GHLVVERLAAVEGGHFAAGDVVGVGRGARDRVQERKRSRGYRRVQRPQRLRAAIHLVLVDVGGGAVHLGDDRRPGEVDGLGRAAQGGRGGGRRGGDGRGRVAGHGAAGRAPDVAGVHRRDLVVVGLAVRDVGIGPGQDAVGQRRRRRHLVRRRRREGGDDVA